MSSNDNNSSHNEALRKAREEGLFQGQVLEALRRLTEMVSKIELDANKQGSEIANLAEIKANRAELLVLEKKIDDLTKKVYTGIGVILAVQALVGLLLNQ